MEREIRAYINANREIGIVETGKKRLEADQKVSQLAAALLGQFPTIYKSFALISELEDQVDAKVHPMRDLADAHAEVAVDLVQSREVAEQKVKAIAEALKGYTLYYKHIVSWVDRKGDKEVPLALLKFHGDCISTWRERASALSQYQLLAKQITEMCNYALVVEGVVPQVVKQRKLDAKGLKEKYLADFPFDQFPLVDVWRVLRHFEGSQAAAIRTVSYLADKWNISQMSYAVALSQVVKLVVAALEEDFKQYLANVVESFVDVIAARKVGEVATMEEAQLKGLAEVGKELRGKVLGLVDEEGSHRIVVRAMKPVQERYCRMKADTDTVLEEKELTELFQEVHGLFPGFSMDWLCTHLCERFVALVGGGVGEDIDGWMAEWIAVTRAEASCRHCCELVGMEGDSKLFIQLTTQQQEIGEKCMQLMIAPVEGEFAAIEEMYAGEMEEQDGPILALTTIGTFMIELVGTLTGYASTSSWEETRFILYWLEKPGKRLLAVYRGIEEGGLDEDKKEQWDVDMGYVKKLYTALRLDALAGALP